jgi:hypothetical protein
VGNADLTPHTCLVDRLDNPRATSPLARLVASRGPEPVVRRDAAKADDADVTIVLGENYRAQ